MSYHWIIVDFSSNPNSDPPPLTYYIMLTSNQKFYLSTAEVSENVPCSPFRNNFFKAQKILEAVPSQNHWYFIPTSWTQEWNSDLIPTCLAVGSHVVCLRPVQMYRGGRSWKVIGHYSCVAAKMWQLNTKNLLYITKRKGTILKKGAVSWNQLSYIIWYD